MLWVVGVELARVAHAVGGDDTLGVELVVDGCAPKAGGELPRYSWRAGSVDSCRVACGWEGKAGQDEARQGRRKGRVGWLLAIVEEACWE